MAKPVTYVIVAAGVGYSVAITLAILGCTTENKFWLLFLFAPYVFTPAMVMFIPNVSNNVFTEYLQSWLTYWNQLFCLFVFNELNLCCFIEQEPEDNQFWTQFAFFIIAMMLVTAFAMPLVFYSNGAIGLTGLGYGLGASFSLYSLGGIAIYCAFAPEAY